MIKKILKYIGFTLLLLLVVLGIGLYLLTKEKYQNILAKRATTYLSKELHTKVEIEHVSISFFNKVHFKGVYIEDDKKDTLAYIGVLGVNASDVWKNYWQDGTQTINDVELEDAYINLYRTRKDSIWNYDFLSTNKDTTTSVATTNEDTTTGSKDFKFDIKNVNCKRIRFQMLDAWVGEDMKYALDNLEIKVKQLDIENKKIGFDKIAIDKLGAEIYEYDGGRPWKKKIDTTEWGTPFNPDNYAIDIAEIAIQNSHVIYKDGNEVSLKKQFDETNIHCSNINASMQNIHIIADTMYAQVNSFEAKERCGLEIKKLQSSLTLSQKKAILSNLFLQTNYSTLSDYFEMDYKNFHSFNDFISDVYMKSTIKDATISSLDVGYFANILNQYPIQIHMKGNVFGTVEDIRCKTFELQTKNTNFKGDAHIIGLPDIDKTLFDVDATNLVTSGSDLQQLIPQLRTDAIAWNKLKSINFKGNYNGYYNNFTTKGTMQTTLGNVISNLHLNFENKIPSYDGYVKTDKLQLGELIKQNTMGALTMDGTIKGAGFDMQNLNATVNATVADFYINNYNYKDIRIDGNVSKRKFEGKLKSNDPNLALNFDGKLDLSGAKPIYNFNAEFVRFNLKQLGITNDPIIGSAKANLDFRGDNIDNFTGHAFLRNVIIENKDKTIYLDSAFLQSETNGLIKTLTLQSSAADAKLEGKFSISQLENAVKLYLYNYLPSYINRPKHFEDQEFTYDVTIKKSDEILKTFTKEYFGLDGSTVHGSINTFTQNLVLDAYVPTFGYKNTQINNIEIKSVGDFNDLNLHANTAAIWYNNNMVIPSADINTSMAHDTASLIVHTAATEKLVGDATFQCKATASDNNLYVTILPSNVNIKNDRWDIYCNNEIVLGEKIIAENLIIESGAQQIKVHTENNGVNTDVLADLKNIDLESISSYVNANEIKYKGRINGSIVAKDVLHYNTILANIYSSTPLLFDTDTLGMLQANMVYNDSIKQITFIEGTKVTRDNSEATIDGTINMDAKTLHLNAGLQNTSIAFLNQYIKDYVSKLRGSATGTVAIKGTFDSPDIDGKLVVKNTACKIIYTGCSYTIDKLIVKIDNNKIGFDDFLLVDERPEAGKALISGSVRHHNFDNIYFNIQASSDNFLALKTQQWDNDMFYGTVPAKLNMNIYGPMDDITMDIDAKTLKGAEFHMPIGGSADASKYDYITFASYGTSQDEQEKKEKKQYYFNVNMNIEATPEATCYIILDQNTQEQIAANGHGNIRLEVDLGNSISMYNTYYIDKGKYAFNFRGVIPKEFDIKEGSSIAWNGDPFKAQLYVDAKYLVGKTDLFPLVQNDLSISEADKASAKTLNKTYVNINLSGPLMQPEIKFDIEQPENKDNSSFAYAKFQQIKNDENEMVTQAGTLLLIGKFTSPQGGSIGVSALKSSTASTVGDVLNTAISPLLNSLFSKIGLDKITANVNYNTFSANKGVDSSGSVDVNSLQVNLSANILKNRVVVDYSNSIDIGRNTEGTRTNNFSGGDFRAQYLISEDGQLRFNAFGNNNFDYLKGSSVAKGGVGLSYKRSFNTLQDLLGISKKSYTSYIKDTLKSEP